jgi:nucleotide-binding universal stress UspA family protein
METTMSYRTILVHVDKADGAAARITLAAELAAREGAHLVGAAMTGVPRFMLAGSPFDLSGTLIADYTRFAAQRADQALGQFREIAARVGVQSAEPRRADEDEYAGLCLQARYADLVVLGHANPDDHGSGGLLLDLPEHVILNCGRPVLLVPYAGAFPTIGKRPLIAWNGSVEAARAVTAALPLLRHASKITIAVFDPQVGGDGHGEEPGADIALYLVRHGLKVEVECCPGPIDVGNAILSRAASSAADLLVMGCYGHSRFREKMLGGATRTVLATMTLPVLMAH